MVPRQARAGNNAGGNNAGAGNNAGGGIGALAPSQAEREATAMAAAAGGLAQLMAVAAVRDAGGEGLSQEAAQLALRLARVGKEAENSQ